MATFAAYLSNKTDTKAILKVVSKLSLVEVRILTGVGGPVL